MIGGGYVGLVSGACFAEFGIEVCIVEIDRPRSRPCSQGLMPIYEPGLDKLVADNLADGRLGFTTELARPWRGWIAVFLAVGTPSRRGDGHADLQYVYAAAERVARALKRDGWCSSPSRPCRSARAGRSRRSSSAVGPDLAIHVACNPEFLREGNAIGDFMRPDRVVIGADSGPRAHVLRRLYRPLYLIETPVVVTSIETAELIKYSANAFLATKITFINEIADLCEKVGADVHDVARGMGLDGRIGRKFLHPGPGYGGSCFPKDTLALVRTAQDYGAPMPLVETTIAVNDARKEAMAERIIAAMRGRCAGQDDRACSASPSSPRRTTCGMRRVLPSCRGWRGAARVIRAFDPEGMEQAAQLLPDSVEYAGDALEAATRRGCGGADDRMERIPRHVARPAARGNARTGDGGPAQRLRPGSHAPSRLRVSRRGPRGLELRSRIGDTNTYPSWGAKARHPRLALEEPEPSTSLPSHSWMAGLRP